ncbi:MAG TPA: hypothetical protein VHX38_25255 [Pseudonocardiaceae bacterium]|jgi:hypothetical protein|nr:hypothetical protein [Pseudonocardiaceae bacterium]
MDYRWRYTDADGAEKAGPGETFAEAAEAEDWLGQQWQDLLADGVRAVTLLDGEDEVYGPMSLLPAEETDQA